MRKLLVGILSIFFKPAACPISRSAANRLGRLFREAKLKSAFKQSGSPLWMEATVKIHCPEAVSIGKECTFESFVTLSSSGAGRGIQIGDKVHIRSGVVMCTGDEPTGGIRIGDSTLINYNAVFLGNGGIEIGKNVLISPGVVVTSFQHGFSDASIPIVEQSPKLAEVVVEDDVYLGSNVTICPGVRIGKSAVIGAGAVVTKNIPAYSVAVGVPADVSRIRAIESK